MARPRPAALLLGNHPFPHGNAPANRMHSLAQTMEAAGLPTLVITDDPNLTDSEVPQLQFSEGVSYISLGAPAGSRVERQRRRRSFPDRALTAAQSLAQGTDIREVVVISNLFTPALRARVRGVLPHASITVDIVEQYSPSQVGRFGFVNANVLRNRFTNWYAAKRADKVIVISRALEVKVNSRRGIESPRPS